ncbi:nitroreductase family deazaflavin-dependent oxidoreductase [Agrococcus sp. DT81.2]|uniref:nitroreductase family deazaflavin-dependent oxidoreductase n=1 Tax=Agrococcus sp. DT81.2 TaxID=3393414 RepID=UPI003CE49329
MGVKQRLRRIGADVHTALFRRFPLARRSAGLPVLLLTVAGRSSGKRFTTPIAYVEHDGGIAVVGTFVGGQEPQWFRNLRAAGTASVDLGKETRTVDVRIADEAEGAAVWERFLDGVTIRVSARQKAGRRSVAVLTPVQPPG